MVQYILTCILVGVDGLARRGYVYTNLSVLESRSAMVGTGSLNGKERPQIIEIGTLLVVGPAATTG